MMDFHVTCNVDKLLKSVRCIRERQLPYAIKEAVNAVAFKARKALIDNYHKKFNVRQKGLPNLIRVDKADKKIPLARVYLDKLFMAKQEYGGEKDAKPGKSVPVPVMSMTKVSPREVVNKDMMTSTGKIKPKFYVSALLAAADGKKKKRRIRNGRKYTENLPTLRKSSKYQPFEIRKSDGTRFIARHIANSNKLEWMYVMYPKVFVPPRWGWQKTVAGVFEHNIVREFMISYSKALKTAK